MEQFILPKYKFNLTWGSRRCYCIRRPADKSASFNPTWGFGRCHCVHRPADKSTSFNPTWVCGRCYCVHRPADNSASFNPTWGCGRCYCVHKPADKTGHLMLWAICRSPQALQMAQLVGLGGVVWCPPRVHFLRAATDGLQMAHLLFSPPHRLFPGFQFTTFPNGEV